MASPSYAGSNHPAMPSSSPGSARQLSPFPPAPKGVRVLSVFSEGQPALAPDSPATASANPRARLVSPRALWLLGLMVISVLVFAAIFRAQLWNQLGR